MNKRIRKKQLKKLGKYIPHSDTYNLDMTIAQFVLPRLELFKNLTDCYPDRDGCHSYEEWMNILDKMIKAFSIISKSAGITRNRDEIQILEEGLDLFRKHYLDLWW